LDKSEYKFEPIQKDSLVVELTKRILDYIFSGSIKPGDKLPAERQLSEALGVGRSAIREAIKSLTVLGILEVRQGYGTYLKRADSTLLTQSIEWSLLLGERQTMDLIEARKEIELTLAKLATERWEGLELEELHQIVEKMKDANLTDFIEYDIQFHLKLSDMARNSVLKDILSSIRSLLRTWIKYVIEKAGETAFSYEDHYAIYKAVAERNAEAAVKAMAYHMDDATKRLIEVLQETEQSRKALQQK